MRMLFLALLCANVLYAAWVWFGPQATPGTVRSDPVVPRFPARLELAGERASTAPDAVVGTSAESAGEGEAAPGGTDMTQSEPVVEAEPASTVRCIGIGPFPDAEVAEKALQRLRQWLPDGALVPATDQVRSSFWVHIPPLASEAEAQAVVADLAGRGIESFVILDEPELRNGISLGVFHDVTSAERHAARFVGIGYPVTIRAALRRRPAFRLQGSLNGELAALEGALDPGLVIEDVACPVVAADVSAD